MDSAPELAILPSVVGQSSDTALAPAALPAQAVEVSARPASSVETTGDGVLSPSQPAESQAAALNQPSLAPVTQDTVSQPQPAAHRAPDAQTMPGRTSEQTRAEPSGQAPAAKVEQSSSLPAVAEVQASAAHANGSTPQLERNASNLENSGHQGEAGPSGRAAAENGVGVAAGRRSVAIKSKDWAGSVVWAKLAKYPWWPAQVLDERDPWIPSDTEPPRRGAIPVRFFGTYDFAWIESQRAICPFEQGYEEHSTKSKQKAFLEALTEAHHYKDTQELPDGFNEDVTPSPQKGLRKGGRAGAGKGRGKRSADATWTSGRGSKRGPDDSSLSTLRSVRERQDSIMQHLVLAPPPESPYSHTVCLHGAQKLLEAQRAGLYPPPQPIPQPQAFVQQPFPGQLQFAQHLQQQHQQFQQQLHPGTQWPMQPALFNPPASMHFFASQPGGVQGALLAAASQHHFAPPKQL